MTSGGAAAPVPSAGGTTAWVAGGALLIASAVLPLVLSPGVVGPLGPLAQWPGMLAFSAAMLLFAFGWRRRGSVVAGRPAGVAGFVVLALSAPLWAIVAAVLPYTVDSSSAWLILGYADIVLRLAAATVAVVATGRARVVPPPWNWAPAWALAAVVGVGVVSQLVAVALTGRPEATVVYGGLSALTAAVSVLVPTALGVLAIVLGSRPDPRVSVQVFPPRG